MVVRRAIHHMRQRPDEDKHAVASSIAFSVVGILLLVWGVFFFRKIQSSPALPSLPVSEEVFGSIDNPRGPSQEVSAPPETYLPIASSSPSESLPEFDFSVPSSMPYDEILRQEEAAMRALRGEGTSSGSTTPSI